MVVGGRRGSFLVRSVRHVDLLDLFKLKHVDPKTAKEVPLQVLVRENNVDQALKVLKRKLQREGLFREMKRRRAYEKPSERRAREKSEAIRRLRKLARKRAQREGLIPMKPRVKQADVAR